MFETLAVTFAVGVGVGVGVTVVFEVVFYNNLALGQKLANSVTAY